MRTVVHLSDLHFGRADMRVVRALLAAVRTIAPDLIAISGDLTQRARRAQFREARTFLDALPAPALVVPGNHDVPLYNIAARFLWPLGGYTRRITPNLAPAFQDDAMVALGVNTTRSLTIKGGAIREEDVTRLAAALHAAPRETIKLVVGHHPLDSTEAARALVDAGADVFLTGHLHITSIGHTAARFEGHARTAVIVEAGTATSTRVRDEHNAFNLLRLAPGAITVEHHEWNGEAFAAKTIEEFCLGTTGWAPMR